MVNQPSGDVYPSREASAEAPADMALAIGHVVCTDERTGRDIIVTGYDQDSGWPITHFAPVDVAEVIIPYDQ